MKCPLCSDGEMVHGSVQRFGPFAQVVWVLAVVGAVAAGAIYVAGSDGKVPRSTVVSGVIAIFAFLLPLSLVLAGVPAWVCRKCGHWAARTALPDETAAKPVAK